MRSMDALRERMRVYTNRVSAERQAAHTASARAIRHPFALQGVRNISRQLPLTGAVAWFSLSIPCPEPSLGPPSANHPCFHPLSIRIGWPCGACLRRSTRRVTKLVGGTGVHNIVGGVRAASLHCWTFRRFNSVACIAKDM